MHNEVERKTVSGKHADLARKAAVESAPTAGVGEFIEAFEDGENLVTYIFESKQKGYLGWQWSVTVFSAKDSATVSEVVLIPGTDALVAPNWVPWSERLADYKALQAELEAQAALAAEEGEDSEDTDDGIDQDFEGEVAEVAENESAVSHEEPAENPEADSEEAGKKPGFLRTRKLFGKKKVRGKAKKPKD